MSGWRATALTAAGGIVIIIAIAIMHPIRGSPPVYNEDIASMSGSSFSEPPVSAGGGSPQQQQQRVSAEEFDDAYARYQTTARTKRWSHVDPLEKLKASARFFEAQFDVAETQKSKEIIPMILQEFDYIISHVLLPSKSRSFDMTDFLFDLIDGTQRIQFRAIKARLQASSSSSGVSSPSPSPSYRRAVAAVSRAAIDTYPLISKYLFAPLQVKAI
jgi:hypothetical protein